MDAARQGYYHAYGGSPGLAWLLDGFAAQMRDQGIDDAVQRSLFVDNPARAFAFDPCPTGDAPRMTGPDPPGRPTGRPAHERDRLARAAVVVRGRDRGRRARRVRPGRSRGDARRRRRPRDPRPGAGRHRRRQRRRDAPGRLLHRRVLPPPDRRPGAPVRPAARCRRPRPAAPVRRRSSRSPRPTAWASSTEFRFATTRTERPLKVTIPGRTRCPGGWRTGPGRSTDTATTPPRRSCRSCARSSRAWRAAGATFIQIDDPSPAIHPEAPSDFAALFNASVEPVVGRVRLGAHLCFGNFLGRPLARRTYRPVLDAMLGFRVDELVLEFANREMAEVEILGEIAAAGRDVAAGVVDVKNYHLESADEVAERIDLVLGGGRAAGAARPGPGLRVQPDRPLGDDGEAGGAGRRSRSRARPKGLTALRRGRGTSAFQSTNLWELGRQVAPEMTDRRPGQALDGSGQTSADDWNVRMPRPLRAAGRCSRGPRAPWRARRGSARAGSPRAIARTSSAAATAISTRGCRTVVSGGPDPLGDRQVVEADDAEILGDVEARLARRLVDPECLQVVSGDDRRRRVRSPEQRPAVRIPSSTWNCHG